MPNAANKKVTYDPSSIGASGLRHIGGYVQEEFLPALRGTKAANVYREMADNDPVVGAILFAITMLIRQVEWTVQATDDSPEAEAAKEFVEEVLFEDMSVPFQTVIDEVCSMFTYGFAPMEIIWKKRIGPDAPNGAGRSNYDDGKIGIRTIALRAQNTITRWEIDPEDGSIDGVWQQPFTGPAVCIPISKMLLFRTTEQRQNPEGRSVLRNAYRPWLFKKRIEEIEGIGIERDLAGLPVAYVPGNFLSGEADVDERRVATAFKEMVKSIKRDRNEGVILPSTRDASGNLMFDLKLLSTGGSRTFDTSKVIDRYDRRIAMCTLADFIFLGQSAVGSFALSSDKTALFSTAIGAFTKSIAEVFNRHLIPRLWKLNGLDYEVAPKLVAGDLETPDLAGLGTFLSYLVGAGAQLFPDRELENHLRKLAGLPPAPEDGSGMGMGDLGGMSGGPGTAGETEDETSANADVGGADLED